MQSAACIRKFRLIRINYISTITFCFFFYLSHIKTAASALTTVFTRKMNLIFNFDPRRTAFMPKRLHRIARNRLGKGKIDFPCSSIPRSLHTAVFRGKRIYSFARSFFKPPSA